MKKLVLIEDAPWRAEKNLLVLKKKGLEIKKIFFFTMEKDVPDVFQKLINELNKNLGVSVEQINKSDFDLKVDPCFKDENIFILLDLNLDDANTFEERVNVQYAKSKSDNGRGKIWFYTTGGKELKSMLVQNFKDQLIDVTDFRDNQLSWDTGKILQIANEG